MNRQKNVDEIFDQLRRKDASRKRKRTLFRGTVKEYLDLVRAKPEMVETPHQKLYRIIMEKGRDEIRYENDPKLFRALGVPRSEVIFRYRAFSEFYGLEDPIEQYVSFLYQAAMDSEDARQAVWLVGPVGGGKSSFSDKNIALLEEETMFVLESFRSNEEFGCHMWDSPLRVLPRHWREELARELGISIPLKDDICPNCKWRLNNEFKNDFLRFPVEEVEYSVRGLVGIGKVTYVEAEEADISELIGSMNLSLMGELPEGHPRVSLPNGICDKMNGGIGVFSEAPNMPASYLTPLNTITQEGRLGTTARQPQVSVRTVLIADSNEEPFLRFFEDEENKKIYDRIVPIFFPYNIRLDEEVSIQQKLIDFSRFKDSHKAPHTLEFVGTVLVLSRLAPSLLFPDPLLKMKILNGEEVQEEIKDQNTTRRVTARDLHGENRWDGMEGISTRTGAKVLGSAFSYRARRGVSCIDPIVVHMIFRDTLERDKILSQDSERIRRYREFLGIALKEWAKKLDEDLTSVYMTVRGEYAESLFQRYLDFADRWLKIQRGEAAEDHTVDTKFLANVEKLVGINDFGSQTNFRQEMVHYAKKCQDAGQPLRYGNHQRMRSALEKLLKKSLKELFQIPHEERIRNPEQQSLFENLIKGLEANGYCGQCAVSAINWYNENMN